MIRPEAEWYNTTIRATKQQHRQAERPWHNTGLTVHREMYSLLSGSPTSLTNKLQQNQNIAARIIIGSGSREHMIPVFKLLHWLPVQQRIKFKTLVLVYKAIKNQAPVYLQDLLHRYVPSQALCSSDKN